MLFLHEKESASLGLCRLLFDRPCLISAHPWPVVDPFIYALPLSLLALIAVSLVTRPLPESFVGRCFSSADKNK